MQRVRIKMKTGPRVERLLRAKHETKYSTCRCAVTVTDRTQQAHYIFEDPNWCSYCGLRKT